MIFHISLSSSSHHHSLSLYPTCHSLSRSYSSPPPYRASCQMPVLSITPLPHRGCVCVYLWMRAPACVCTCICVCVVLFTLQTAISHTKTFPFTELGQVGDGDGKERMKTGWLNHETAEKQATDEWTSEALAGVRGKISGRVGICGVIWSNSMTDFRVKDFMTTGIWLNMAIFTTICSIFQYRILNSCVILRLRETALTAF